MKRFILFIASVILTISRQKPAPPARPNAIYNSNGSPTDVQRIHDTLAQQGDTITLPTGTFAWSTGINLTKAITLQGAGAGITIVRDAGQSDRLITWNLSGTSNGAARMTGMTFQDGGRVTHIDAPGGVVNVTGSNTNGTTFRWDHCALENLNGVIVFDTVIGVYDHNNDQCDTGIFLTFLDDNWNNDSIGRGDNAWSDPTNFGGSNFFFVEDNTYTGVGGVNAFNDAFGGARYVLRHNTIINGKIPTHGTESGGRFRSVRAYEVYNNTFQQTGTTSTNLLGLCRGGVVLFHDNTFINWTSQGFGIPNLSLQDFRIYDSFLPQWSGADGTSPWDANNPGGVFFAGMAGANSSGQTVMVSGNPNWTTNQWAAYTIRRTTNLCGASGPAFGYIFSNTSDTITYSQSQYTSSLSFCTGDNLEVRKVDHALDQPGRAGGTTVMGFPAVPPAGWPPNNQVTEPCYSWNNRDEQSNHINFVGIDIVKANVHYFNDTPMPGYTPFVYPHPLVAGGTIPDGGSTPDGAGGAGAGSGGAGGSSGGAGDNGSVDSGSGCGCSVGATR